MSTKSKVSVLKALKGLQNTNNEKVERKIHIMDRVSFRDSIVLYIWIKEKEITVQTKFKYFQELLKDPNKDYGDFEFITERKEGDPIFKNINVRFYSEEGFIKAVDEYLEIKYIDYKTDFDNDTTYFTVG